MGTQVVPASARDPDLHLDLMSPSSVSLATSAPASANRSRASHVETFKFEASVKHAVPTPPVFSYWPGTTTHVWSSLEFVFGYFEQQLEDDVDLFMDAWCSKYEENLLENHGLKMNCSSKLLAPENLQPLMSTANVFVIFLESKIAEADYKALQNLVNVMKSSSTLKALFCFKQTEQSCINGSMARLKKLLSKINSNESQYCLFIENYQQMEPLVDLVNESIDQFIKNQFSDGVLGECSCYRDMRGLLYQKDAFSSILENLPTSQQMSSIDQYVFCINRHIIKDGYVPPLIVKSDPGCGKSTVVAHFLRKHKNSNPANKILYHFVDTTLCSQDGGTMMRRFIASLSSTGSFVGSNSKQNTNFDSFSQLLETFPRQKVGTQEASANNLSSGTSLLVICIDSADRLSDCEKVLEWVQDPLPPDVRVILSVDNNTCPVAWASMTSINIKPQAAIYTSHLNEAQKKKVSELGINSPFFAKLLTKVDLSHIPPSIVTKVSNSPNLGKEVTCKALISTVAHLANNNVGNVYKVLYFITQAAQGLSSYCIIEMWRQFHPSLTQHDIKLLRFMLEKLHISKIVSVRLGNLIISSPFLKRLVISRMQEKDASLVKEFPNKFLIGLESPFQLSDHLPLEVIIECLIILTSDEKYLDRLKSFVCRVVVFMHLFKFDLTAVIMEVFAKLKIGKESITDEFSNELSQLEQKSDRNNVEYLLDAIESFAVFNANLSNFSKSAYLYERSLEIRELNLEPDHPSCSKTLYLNALLHFKWDKIDVAETLLKQSIDVLQSSTPTSNDTPNLNYMQFVQNCELLELIYQRLGKVKQFESNFKKLSYLRSMTIIQEFLENGSSEPFSASTLAESTPDSVAKANHLNEYAVLMFYQGNFEDAETSFKASLAIREKLLGEKHADCSQSLFNLGGLYFERKDYNKSVDYFERAVAIRKQPMFNKNLLMTSLQWLVIAYRKSGSREKALELLKDLVTLNIETHGGNHQFVATNYANMASIYCEMKQFKDALPLFEKALHAFKAALGPYDVKVSDTLNNMALLKFEMNELDEAVNLYRQAQECRQIGLGLRQTSASQLPLTPTQSRHRRLGSDFQSQQSLNSVLE